MSRRILIWNIILCNMKNRYSEVKSNIRETWYAILVSFADIREV